MDNSILNKIKLHYNLVMEQSETSIEFNVFNYTSFRGFYTSARSVMAYNSDTNPCGVDLYALKILLAGYLLKMLNIRHDYLFDYRPSYINFNKQMTAPEVNTWVTRNKMLSDYKEHGFIIGHIPQSAKQISTSAKTEMAVSLMKAFNMTESNRVTAEWELYFKPVDCTLFKLYYDKECDCLLCLTDYVGESNYDEYGWTSPPDVYTQVFKHNELNKLFFGQFLIRENVEELDADAVDIYERTILNYFNYSASHSNLKLHDNDYDMNPFSTMNAFNTPFLNELSAALEQIYYKNKDVYDNIEQEMLSTSIKNIIKTKVKEIENNISRQRDIVETQQTELRREYDRLNQLLDQQRYMYNDSDQYVKDYVAAINKAIDKSPYDVTIASTNANQLVFDVIAPVGGIDVDDLEELSKNLEHRTRNMYQKYKEYATNILAMLSGEDDVYEIIFGTRCAIQISNGRPEYINKIYIPGKESKQYYPNTHLWKYNCWGSAFNTLLDLYSSQSYLEMFAVFFRACTTLNLRDHTVIDSFFTNIYDDNFMPIRNKVTGQLLTFDEYIEEITHDDNQIELTEGEEQCE